MINIRKLVFGISKNCDVLITQSVLLNIKPYYVTFFMNNPKESTWESNFIIQEVTKHVPTIIKNVLISQRSTINSPAMYTTSKARHALNILLYSSPKNDFGSILYDIQNFTQVLIQTKSYKITKTLVIFLSNDYIHENVIKTLCEYAWQHQILDFTIVTGMHATDSMNNCIMWNYNPFYEIVNFEYLNPNVTIFPDKLNNVNGYKMKLGIIDADLYTKIMRDELSNTTNLIGPYVSMTSLILKFLNFSTDFVQLGINNSFIEGEHLLFEKLQNNELNMFAIPEVSNTYPTFEISRIALERNYHKYVAWINNDNSLKLYISKELIMALCIIPLVIVIITHFMQVYNILENNSPTINILQVLFAVSIRVQPKMIRHRLFFLCIIFISYIYSNSFFSDLNAQLLRNNIPFDTFEDIYHSGLKIFTYKGNFAHLFWKSDVYVQKIKNITEALEYTRECGIRLYKGKNNICIMHNIYECI